MSSSNHFLAFCGIIVLVFVVKGGRAIKCWECNSHYDANCADPFENYTFALTDCSQRSLSHYPNTRASLCRKIVQKVNENYRYIRGCGWLPEEKEGVECVKRAGTFNVLVQYCNCKDDGCNLATQNGISWITVITVVTLILAIK